MEHEAYAEFIGIRMEVVHKMGANDIVVWKKVL